MVGGITTIDKKNYDSLDLMKFIACFFVLAIHSDPLQDVSPFLNTIICQGLARLAVPLFFTSSAFFFFKKDITPTNTKKYCTRLGILYLSWFIVSLPKTILERLVWSSYPLPETIFRFVRSFFVTSTFSGSWFIVSCAFCAILFSSLERLPEKARRTVTIAISVIVYFISVFTSAYGHLIATLGLTKTYSIYTLLFANPYDNVFTGIPYFALGRWFARQTFTKKPTPLQIIIPIILLALEAQVTALADLKASNDCYLLLFPCVYAIFVFLLHLDIKLPHAKVFRATSTIVFFSQFLWLFAAEFIEWSADLIIPSYGKFSFGLVGTLLTTFVILKLGEKPFFRWLKFFY